jgi:ankyrin repeat protein
MKPCLSLLAISLCLGLPGCSDKGSPASSVTELPTEQVQPWLLHSEPERFYDDRKVIALCEAVRRQRVEEVERLLIAGFDINAIGKQGVRPIVWCLPVSDDCLELLVRNGADVNFSFSGPFSGSGIHGERTPLTSAALHYDANTFALILDHANDPNLGLPRNGPRPLSWAVATAAKDSAIKVRLFICKGATVNIPGEDPPILIRAITARKYDAALVLIEHGADVSVKDRKGADVTTLVQAALQDEKCTLMDKIRLNAILERLKPIPPVDPNNKYPTPDDVQ